jgi:hypothetical protein
MNMGKRSESVKTRKQSPGYLRPGPKETASRDSFGAAASGSDFTPQGIRKTEHRFTEPKARHWYGKPEPWQI